MSKDPVAHVAQALAWGFLAAPKWTEGSLISAGTATLGEAYPWMRSIVRKVRSAHRFAPTDAPSRLAQFIQYETALASVMLVFDDSDEDSDEDEAPLPPVRVRQIFTVPGRMVTQRWPVPTLDDPPGLAKLLDVPMEQLPWVADLKGMQRRTPAGPLHLYRYRWITRPNGTPRLLESPTPLLRQVLRRLLEKVLLWVPVHPAAHGFVRGRSVLTNSAPHVGADVLLCMDLRNFFTAITRPRVYGLFRSMGYPEAVANTLTGLTTHRTPNWVLQQMPPGGDSTVRHVLRAQLRAAHLPQGAPTSPGLANLAAYVLDCRLTGYSAAIGATYSRYADDLTFSGPGDVPVGAVIRAVTEFAVDEGFSVNPDKTRVEDDATPTRYRSRRQCTPGGSAGATRTAAGDSSRRSAQRAYGCEPYGYAEFQGPSGRPHRLGRVGESSTGPALTATVQRHRLGT